MLFVSHNLAIISSLCQRAFWLDQGSLIDSGAVNEVLRTYHAHKQQSANEEHVVTTSALRWRGLQNRTSLDGLRNDEDLLLELGFESGQDPLNNMQVDIALVDEREQVSLHCRSKFVRKPISVPANTSFVILRASSRLAPGHYHLTVYATTGARDVLLTGFNSAVRLRAGGVVFDTSGDVVCARAGQTLVRLQTPEELQILEEIYLAGTYHFQLTGPLLIVDIGMNTAFTALYFAAMHPDAVICAYEPFADTFHFAEANIALNPLLKQRIRTNHFGLLDFFIADWTLSTLIAGGERRCLRNTHRPPRAQRDQAGTVQLS